MAYTTVNKSSVLFNTVLYNSTGNDNLAISGVGFEPSLTWIKKRNVISGSDTNEAHMLADQVRGSGYYLKSTAGTAQTSTTNDLKSWQSDGFTLGTVNRVNQGSTPHRYVAWNWKASGAGSANTDGSINTTKTSVDTAGGFSISQYTGTGSGATVGHGLGATPKLILWKRLDNGSGDVNWIVQSPLFTNRNKLVLNTTEAKSQNSSFANTDSWTNDVFSVGTYEGQNTSGGTYIAYAFAEKAGYSKFGTYQGVSNANGTFIYTGFKPAFVMMKSLGRAESWYMFDNKREGFNVDNDQLYADTEASEATTDYIDFLSNGIKLRYNSVGLNGTGESYFYMAFGQSLVGSNNVPCTAY